MTGPKVLTGVEYELAIIADLHKQIAAFIADREERIEREWALRERVERLEAALRGANWIIEKLKGYEGLAYVHGIRCTIEDAEQGGKYRAMIDAALADVPSVVPT